eukprot:1157396-Pelagomonas_calceolata.AAC.7
MDANACHMKVITFFHGVAQGALMQPKQTPSARKHTTTLSTQGCANTNPLCAAFFHGILYCDCALIPAATTPSDLRPAVSANATVAL